MIGDPREIGQKTHGTPLRDASVNPRSTDFLPPSNAGVKGENGNPHGPKVVSPGIHALEEVHPLRSGAISSDAATQSKEEMEHMVKYQPTAAKPGPELKTEPATDAA